MKKILLFTLLIISIFAFFKILERVNNTKIPIATETETPDTETVEPKVTTYLFENLGITLDVPNNLAVTKQPTPNLEDPNKLDSYIFYIQNDMERETLGTKDFQMYGLYQFDLPDVTWEQFSSIKNNPEMYEYINEIEINNIKGYSTQLIGERNNYVYEFHLGNRILRISVSPATEENRVVAEEIINTMKLEMEPTQEMLN